MIYDSPLLANFAYLTEKQKNLELTKEFLYGNKIEDLKNIHLSIYSEEKTHGYSILIGKSLLSLFLRIIYLF